VWSYWSGSMVSLPGLLGLTGLLDVAGPFGIASLHCLAGVLYSGWDIWSTVVNLLAISGMAGLTMLLSCSNWSGCFWLVFSMLLDFLAVLAGLLGCQSLWSCLTSLLSLAGLTG
jgi:hypothetical protein